MVKGDVVENTHASFAALREMDSVGDFMGIVIVVHKEVVNAVVHIAVYTNRMNQLMDSEAAHEAQLGIAEAVVVNHMCLVCYEMAEQRAGEEPFTHCGTTALDVAEWDIHQTELGFIAVEGGSIHGEVDGEAFLVVDNLRLCRLKVHVLGHAHAFVVDAHAKFGRNAGLNLVLRESVVAQDVALHEIVDTEVWAGIDGELNGVQIEHDFFLRVRIQEGECSAKRVYLRCGRRSVLCRNELYQSRAVQASTQGAIAVDARDVVERCGVDLEQVGTVLTRFCISDHEVEVNILDGVHFVAVVDREGAVEGLARHGHGLRELYRHASAHAVALTAFFLFYLEFR